MVVADKPSGRVHILLACDVIKGPILNGVEPHKMHAILKRSFKKFNVPVGRFKCEHYCTSGHLIFECYRGI